MAWELDREEEEVEFEEMSVQRAEQRAHLQSAGRTKQLCRLATSGRREMQYMCVKNVCESGYSPQYGRKTKFLFWNRPKLRLERNLKSATNLLQAMQFVCLGLLWGQICLVCCTLRLQKEEQQGFNDNPSSQRAWNTSSPSLGHLNNKVRLLGNK